MRKFIKLLLIIGVIVFELFYYRILSTKGFPIKVEDAKGINKDISYIENPFGGKDGAYIMVYSFDNGQVFKSVSKEKKKMLEISLAISNDKIEKRELWVGGVGLGIILVIMIFPKMKK